MAPEILGFIFFLTVGLLCDGISGLCTREDIRNCAAVLLRGDDPADSQAVMEHLLFHRITINEWCRNSPRMMRCLDRQMDHCDDSEKLMLDGFNNMLNKLCTGDTTAKENYRQCSQESNLHRHQRQCNNVYTAEMNDVNRAPPKLSMKMICKVTRKYLKCQWKTMQKTCGKHAADWQVRTHREMIQPTMDFADCDLDDAGLSTGAIVGIVIACLAGVTILMLIIIYCIRKQ